MSKQIPEEVPSREQQLEALREKLLGHEVFGRQRGKWKISIANFIRSLIYKSKSPSEFRRRLQRAFSDITVLGNMLAQYDRDKWESAYNNMFYSLRDAEFWLPGESVPVQETFPVTIVIPEFERTLTLIRWIVERQWGFEIEAYIRGEEIFEDEKWASYKSDYSRDEAEKVLEALPSFVRIYEENPQGYNYNGLTNSISEAYWQDVLYQFPQFYESNQWMKQGFLNEQIQSFRKGWYVQFPVALVFCCTRKTVLKKFSRKQQKKIVTWHFRIPKIYRPDFTDKDLLFGFYREDEHKYWSREYTALTCKKPSHGF